MVGAIQGCTGQEPILVGKPSPLLLDYIVHKYQVKHHEICVVGDRLDTDIQFGKQNGTQTVLTLSGVTSMDMLQNATEAAQPDYFIPSIAHLLPPNMQE